MIWIVPLLAILVGLGLAVHAIRERGPEVSLQFALAEGLEANKTRVKFKDVDIGVVKAIALNPDRKTVKVTVQMDKQAEELLQEKFAGAINAGRPMLLDRGMDWVQLSISPEDAQMLQSRAFSVEEVCRFFGVPPFMVGHTEKTTSWGTGLEQQTLGSRSSRCGGA